MTRASLSALMLSLAALVLVALPCAADEFIILGPRAMGMGGAAVADTSDALAGYWNPAGLALDGSLDIRIVGSLHAIDRLGLADIIDEVQSADLTDTSAANIQRLLDLVNELGRPETSVAARGAAGIYLRTRLGGHTFGLNVADISSASTFLSVFDPTIPIQGGELTNDSELALRGFEARQVGISYAHAFLNRSISVGATVKGIQGLVYSTSQRVLDTDANGALDIIDEFLNSPERSTDFGIDVGATLQPLSSVRLGVVARNLNTPTFDAPGGGDLELFPQVRAGVALKPFPSLTLAADGDLTVNDTRVPSVKSRMLSFGGELTLPWQLLSARIGALTDLEDTRSNTLATAGIGAKLIWVRADIGGGYDFRRRQGMASISVALSF